MLTRHLEGRAAMRKTSSPILLAALLFVLSACAASVSFVSFQNAKLGPRDQNIERVSGILAKPEGKGPFPAVVLLHTCSGLQSHVKHDWPNYLTNLGYVVLTVDTFGSRGYGPCPNGMGWGYEEFTRDAYGALDYLASQPFVDKNGIAVMGFSRSAMAINSAIIPWRLRASGGLDFKAAIALYGKCQNIGLYPEGSIPLMEIVGDKDEHHAPSCRYAWRISPEIEVHVLPGAHHAFDKPEASGGYNVFGTYALYSASATKKAQELTKTFLEKHFGK